MLKKALRKLSPKNILKHENKDIVTENTDQTQKTEEEEFDVEKIIYTDDIMTDLWIYIKNNNILFGLFLSDTKHPFKKKRRLMIFISYVSLLVLISSLIAKHSIFCKSKHHKKSHGSDEDDDIHKICENKFSVLSLIIFLLGIIVLHRFVKMITKCAKIGTAADDHKHNYIVQIILSCIGAQFIILISIVTSLLLLKGVFTFMKLDEAFIKPFEYVTIITIISLIYELCHDIYNFFPLRRLEIQAKKIRNGKFDPHADMRGDGKRRNIHVRVGW